MLFAMTHAVRISAIHQLGACVLWCPAKILTENGDVNIHF